MQASFIIDYKPKCQRYQFIKFSSLRFESCAHCSFIYIYILIEGGRISSMDIKNTRKYHLTQAH